MKNRIWLALPDGHQQTPTEEFLTRAGLRVAGYDKSLRKRRLAVEGLPVDVKVVRPQDMPLHVANGHFDVGITGQDWLAEHLSHFPGSPVKKLCDLDYGNVRICAAVHNDLGVDTVAGLIQLAQKGLLPRVQIRVASEYFGLADKYCRENHFPRYLIIPTRGSTEAFLPEDADLIVENAQTGRTLVENNLKVIDVLFESTACVVANLESLAKRAKGTIIRRLQQILGKAA